MSRLEDLKPGAAIRGILPNGVVTVVNTHWMGTDSIDLTYRDAAGEVDSELLFREDETRLEIVTAGLPWSFDADGDLAAAPGQMLSVAFAVWDGGAGDTGPRKNISIWQHLLLAR